MTAWGGGGVSREQGVRVMSPSFVERESVFVRKSKGFLVCLKVCSAQSVCARV